MLDLLNMFVHILTLYHSIFNRFIIEALFRFSVKVLIFHGADIYGTDSCDWTSLMLAAKGGQLKVVEVRF